MRLWLSPILVASSVALADQPKPPVCHFPDKVEITLSVVALDTIALSLTKTTTNPHAYVQTLRELSAINAELRAKYCK